MLNLSIELLCRRSVNYYVQLQYSHFNETINNEEYYYRRKNVIRKHLHLHLLEPQLNCGLWITVLCIFKI